MIVVKKTTIEAMTEHHHVAEQTLRLKVQSGCITLVLITSAGKAAPHINKQGYTSRIGSGFQISLVATYATR